jgi:hypothetical protein
MPPRVVGKWTTEEAHNQVQQKQRTPPHYHTMAKDTKPPSSDKKKTKEKSGGQNVLVDKALGAWNSITAAVNNTKQKVKNNLASRRGESHPDPKVGITRRKFSCALSSVTLWQIADVAVAHENYDNTNDSLESEREGPQ